MKYDLLGKRFGKLLVIESAGRAPDRQIIWRCECDCGNIVYVNTCSLTGGETRSCGCLRIETSRRNKKNPLVYDIYNSTAVCYTSSGNEFYVDAEDIDRIKDHSWYIGKNGYVYGHDSAIGRAVLLHRYILGVFDRSITVDHIDRNPLNNRKTNLRLCTHCDNQRNIGIRNNNSSGYTGVCWDKNKHKWSARIYTNGKQISLGLFDNYSDAVIARYNEEKKLWGKFSPYDDEYINNLIGR